jgi:hypothetical protein
MQETFLVLCSRVGSWPCPQTLDLPRTNALAYYPIFVNYDHKKFYNIGPRSHAISVLRQYEKEHAKKMEDLINGLIHQMQLLFEG